MFSVKGRRVACLALAACCLPLTACERMLNRSMNVVSPHIEQTYQDETDSVEFSDYAQLLKILREWMRAGVEKGTLSFTGFEGDAATAVTEAFGELIYNDAYGQFVGVYMSSIPDPKSKLVTINISYFMDRPREEIEALKNISSSAGLQSELRTILRSFSPFAALELRYSRAEDLNLTELLETVYFQNPLYALGIPHVTSTFHRGVRSASAILELHMEYTENAETLARLQAEVRTLSGELASQADTGLALPALALQLHDMVCEYIEYDHETADRAIGLTADRQARSYSMLGAMLDRKAVSEGYALAYKALCDAVQIPCEVVTGTYEGNIHAWNIIQLGGGWYMVDTSIDDYDENISHARFLGSDESWLDARYTWNAAKHPKSESGPLTYDEVLKSLQTPESPSPSETP